LLFRFSGIDAEQPVDEGRLGPAAHGLDPQPELAFLEHPHHLEALDRRVGRLHRLEAERRLDQALQFPVVALQPIVEILHLPVLGLIRQEAFLLQLGDRLAIGGVLVGIDDVRLPVAAAAQCLGEKPLRRLGVASVGEIEVERRATFVDRPVQLFPLALDADLGLVDPPREAGPVLVPQRPLLQLRGVALDPAVERCVVDGDAAFAHHLLELAIADAVAAVPAHAQEDQLTGKVPPLELAAHCQLRRSSARRRRSSPRRFLQRSRSEWVWVWLSGRNGASALT
jgi:hypothetical protein